MVSVKPSLQSVPELGPAEPESLAAFARGHLFSDGLEYLDADALTSDGMLSRVSAGIMAASPGGNGGMDMHGDAGPSSSHALYGGTHSMVSGSIHGESMAWARDRAQQAEALRSAAQPVLLNPC
jgi:hypothetical protein